MPPKTAGLSRIFGEIAASACQACPNRARIPAFHGKRSVSKSDPICPFCVLPAPKPAGNIDDMYSNESADVFRIRQALGDLRAETRAVSSDVLARIAGNGGNLDPLELVRRVAEDELAFTLPRDEDLVFAVLLAAALPDDDFPAFAHATVLLLIDRLSAGGSRDDLYWNWDAFADQYRLAEAQTRAAIMGGFRALTLSRGLWLSNPPTERDCLTLIDDRPDEAALSAEDAGALWQARSRQDAPLTREERRVFRFLVEREAGMAPSDPEAAPLVPPIPR